MGSEKSRRERIAELYQQIHEAGQNLNVKELYAEMALKHGITFRTFWSYLKTLEIAGKIEPILSLEQFKKQLRIE